MVAPIPSGESPDGTGGSPVLPSRRVSPHLFHELLEVFLVPDAVQPRFHLEVRYPAGVLLDRLVQPTECLGLIAESYVDERDFEWGQILSLLRPVDQLREHLTRHLGLAGDGVGVPERRELDLVGSGRSDRILKLLER